MIPSLSCAPVILTRFWAGPERASSDGGTNETIPLKTPHGTATAPRAIPASTSLQILVSASSRYTQRQKKQPTEGMRTG